MPPDRLLYARRLARRSNMWTWPRIDSSANRRSCCGSSTQGQVAAFRRLFSVSRRRDSRRSGTPATRLPSSGSIGRATSSVGRAPARPSGTRAWPCRPTAISSLTQTGASRIRTSGSSTSGGRWRRGFTFAEAGERARLQPESRSVYYRVAGSEAIRCPPQGRPGRPGGTRSSRAGLSHRPQEGDAGRPIAHRP